MLPTDPDYPRIILSFTYRGFQLDLDESEDNGQPIFSVWANHDQGCAVAVPGVVSRSEAIYKAKQWVNCRLNPKEGNSHKYFNPPPLQDL